MLDSGNAEGLIQFATWQSVVVIVVSAFAALMAHKALAVFNDGARPFMLDFIQGRTSRAATATIVFGLSAGFIFGLGAPMALSTSVLNPWLIFLPVEILGLLAPWPWLALLAGSAWGAVCAFGLSATNTLAHELPVDFITALQQISTPILWLFAMFPVLAVAKQFGKAKGIWTFVAEIAAVVLFLNIAPTVYGGAIAMAVGVIMLVAFAIAKDLAARRAEAEAHAALSEAEQAEALAAKAAEAEVVDQLFGPNALRLRKNIVWFAVLGGLVAALASAGIFGGGEATSFLIADGNFTEAAQIDAVRALGFIPLIATTALASGAYAMAGFTFVYPVGYLIGAGIDSWPLALGLAFAAGALVMAAEVGALSWVGMMLQRWPSVRDSADHIRSAITESLSMAILVGSLMAGLTMAGGLGIALVGGLYLLNESIGRPVIRMAAGPTAVIISGIFLNLLVPLGWFTPIAG